MKILYAAGQGFSSRIQMERFNEVISQFPNVIVKYASYQSSRSFLFPQHWCLNFIKRKSKTLIKNVDELARYESEVLNYKPDLILSDCEPATVEVAVKNKIPYWVYSSKINTETLLGNRTYGLPVPSDKKDINQIQKSERYYAYDHADKIFLISVFGDTTIKFTNKNKNCEIVRPYYLIGDEYYSGIDAKIIINSVSGTKILIDAAKKYKKSIYFSQYNENYIGIKNIDINNELYINLLKTSDIVIGEQVVSHWADAFYNNKIYYYINNLNDYGTNNHFKLGEFKDLTCSYSKYTILSKLDIKPVLDENIKYIHEHIEGIL